MQFFRIDLKLQSSYYDDSEFCAARNALTTAYIEDGNVMLWKEGSQKAENLGKIGSFGEIYLVSDDGSNIIWKDTEEDFGGTLKAFENGEETFLMELDPDVPTGGILFSGDEKAVLAATGMEGELCLKKWAKNP